MLRKSIKIYGISGGKNKCCGEIEGRERVWRALVWVLIFYREVKKSFTDKVTFEQKPERNLDIRMQDM